MNMKITVLIYLTYLILDVSALELQCNAPFKLRNCCQRGDSGAFYHPLSDHLCYLGGP